MSCTTPRIFAGIDWAENKHDVCVRDPGGATLKEWTLANTAADLAALAARLSAMVDGENEAAFISIEIPHGPVVETLLDAGFSVFSINTKQSDRFRDRFSLPGAKDDRLDALVLADSLRTDTHLFRRWKTTRRTSSSCASGRGCMTNYRLRETVSPTDSVSSFAGTTATSSRSET